VARVAICGDKTLNGLAEQFEVHLWEKSDAPRNGTLDRQPVESIQFLTGQQCKFNEDYSVQVK
jgi:hypothetical protein